MDETNTVAGLFTAYGVTIGWAIIGIIIFYLGLLVVKGVYSKMFNDIAVVKEGGTPSAIILASLIVGLSVLLGFIITG